MARVADSLALSNGRQSRALSKAHLNPGTRYGICASLLERQLPGCENHVVALATALLLIQPKRSKKRG